MLNRIWAFLVMFAVFVGFCHAILLDGDNINAMANALFANAKLGFELTLGLAASLILWLGIFQIAEAAGVVLWLSKALTPMLHRLMPDVPRGHPAFGSMGMNVSMSMLGIDNGALPSGLKAMAQLQTLNADSEEASKAQQMFLVYMTTSVTLFPVSILGFRMAAGAANPADVFLPLLIASYVGLFAGLAFMSISQQIKLTDPILLFGTGAFLTSIVALTWLMSTVATEVIGPFAALLGNASLLAAVFFFTLLAWLKKVPVYDTFLEGAKNGFDMAVNLLPYVIGMFVAIGLLRTSGTFELLEQALTWALQSTGLSSQWVIGVPQGILKSFSGSAANALMLDTFKNNGVDSYAGHLSAIIQGSSDTTFYILSVCAGAAKIKNLGAAVTGCILADIASFVTAVACAHWFFGS